MNILGIPLLTFLEIIGVITGVIAVYLNFREHIIGWPIGIISVTCYAVVFFYQKIYADMGLQLFYIGMNAYGWHIWDARKNKSSVQVIGIRLRQIIYVGLFIIIFGIMLTFFLKEYTDARLPMIDALLCASSLAAQYLLAKKIVENWFLWIIIDLVYVGMYLRLELYYTTILYIIFTGLAIWAYITWRKKWILSKHD